MLFFFFADVWSLSPFVTFRCPTVKLLRIRSLGKFGEKLTHREAGLYSRVFLSKLPFTQCYSALLRTRADINALVGCLFDDLWNKKKLHLHDTT